MSELVKSLSFRYELLNSDGSHKNWLYTVNNCSVSYKWLTQLKCSAKLNVGCEEDSKINYLTDRIKIYMTLDDVTTSLGVFLLSSSTVTVDSCRCKYRTVSGYSLLQLLIDDKLTTRLQLPIGTNVINEIIRQIGNNAYNIDPGNYTTSTVKEYEIGTSRIEVINDLLDSIGYNSLYCTAEGVFTTSPYILPSDRTHTVELKSGANNIQTQIVNELDLFNIPNVFVSYSNSLDITPPISYTYENNNASSITSTVNRCRRIVDCQPVDASDMNSLEILTKKRAYEASSVYGHVTFNAAITDKLLGVYMPCVWIKVNDVNDKYLVTSVDFTCSVGATLKCKGRKAVNI